MISTAVRKPQILPVRLLVDLEKKTILKENISRTIMHIKAEQGEKTYLELSGKFVRA